MVKRFRFQSSILNIFFKHGIDDCTKNQHLLFEKIRAGISGISRAIKSTFAVFAIEPRDTSLNKNKACFIVFQFRHG